ncbi:hypothetical protein ACEQPO_16730 [Bacillus sp. SL00103]
MAILKNHLLSWRSRIFSISHFKNNGWKKMAVIRQNQSDDALLEEAKEKNLIWSEVLLSKQRAWQRHLLKIDCPVVPIETSGNRSSINW